MPEYLVFKQKTAHKNPDGKTFAWMNLFFCAGNGAFWTIFPLILFDIFQQKEVAVGIYSSILAFIVLIGTLLSSVIFTKYSKILLFKIALIVSIVVLILMTAASEIWQIAGLDIPRALCVLVIRAALSLFIFEFSQKNTLASDEGRFYLFNNLGWILGPLSAGFTAKFFGNSSVFILVSFYFLVTLLYFLHQHLVLKNPHITHQKMEKKHLVWHNLSDYFKNKELRRAYFVSLGLFFWWAIALVYFPIIIHEYGFSQEVVGYATTATIIPLVLLEGVVGKMADRHGVKRHIIFGYAMMVICAILMIFLQPYPLLFIGTFILLSFGTANIEPLQEAYFFKVTNKTDAQRFIGVFETKYPIASITGPIFAALMLSLGYGFSALWIACAIILSFFLILSTTIKKGY